MMMVHHIEKSADIMRIASYSSAANELRGSKWLGVMQYITGCGLHVVAAVWEAVVAHIRYAGLHNEIISC